MCAKRTGTVNLCTKCTNLNFTPPNLSFKVRQVQPLSGSPGRTYRCGSERTSPQRTSRHTGRDKVQSNASTCGKRIRDKDWDNRAGLVRCAHRYGFQKCSYLTFMCYISSNIAINHDIGNYTYINNRQKPPIIDRNNPKVTNTRIHGIIFASLSSTP